MRMQIQLNSSQDLHTLKCLIYEYCKYVGYRNITAASVCKPTLHTHMVSSLPELCPLNGSLKMHHLPQRDSKISVDRVAGFGMIDSSSDSCFSLFYFASHTQCL